MNFSPMHCFFLIAPTECDAQKEPKPVKLWYKTLEKGKQGFTLVSNEEARLHPRSNHPFFSGVIGGLTTKMVRGDCLHILFCKGVLGHFLGSIMHYLCWHDGPGKVQAVAPEKRLGAMFEAIQGEYVRQSSPTRVTNLRLSMICDPKQPHASFAHLDLKLQKPSTSCMPFCQYARHGWMKGLQKRRPCSRPCSACQNSSSSLMGQMLS